MCGPGALGPRFGGRDKNFVKPTTRMASLGRTQIDK